MLIIDFRCSRNHSIALDRKNQVWLFTNWGRPVRLTSPVLNTEIRQVETGWDSSYILATDGSAFIQRPHGDIARAIGAYNDTQNVRGEQAKVAEIDGVVKCQPWDLDADLVELPAIPSSLPSLGVDGQEKTLLVKLAAGERFVIGLTNKGHVLKLDFDENESDDELRLSFTRGSRQWEYVCFKLEGQLMTTVLTKIPSSPNLAKFTGYNPTKYSALKGPRFNRLTTCESRTYVELKQ
jgi:SCF-associated factor 1